MNDTIIYDNERYRLKELTFIDDGGQADVYKLNDLALKLFNDPTQVPDSKKIEELSVMDNPFIIRPLGFVYSPAGEIIGYAMQSVENAVPLTQWLSQNYRNNNGITDERLFSVIQQLRDLVAYVHSKYCLIVDLNDGNFLINAQDQIYAIDVDSYQTPSFRAEALKPTVKDWTATENDFTCGSDWYAFAVISFQLLLGIHPYKGSHPDFKRGDLASRVKAGISVLNKVVKFPSSVRDFSVVPDNYMDWFRDTFEAKNRNAAPAVIGNVTLVQSQFVVPQASLRLNFAPFNQYDSAVRAVNSAFDCTFVQTARQVIWASGNHMKVTDYGDPSTVFVISPEGVVLLAKVQEGQLHYLNAKSGKLLTGQRAKQLFVVDNRLYSIDNKRLIEYSLIEMNGNIRLGPIEHKLTGYQSALYNQVVVQNILGRVHVSLPYGEKKVAFTAMPELDKKTLINAKYSGGHLMTIVRGSQGYTQQLWKFTNTDHSEYTLIDEREAESFDIQMTTLPSGVVITLLAEGTLWAMNTHPASNDITVVEDPAIQLNLRLYNGGQGLMASVDNQLFKLSLK